MERPPQGDQRDLVLVRTGIPWRDLPERLGSWKTVYERHRRWSADGTWDRILCAVQADADLARRIDWSMVGVDSTSCRAHQHAAALSARRSQIKHTVHEPKDQRANRKRRGSKGGLTVSTPRSTNAATKSSARSTGSRTPEPSPPATARGPTFSTAPSPLRLSGYGCGAEPARSSVPEEPSGTAAGDGSRRPRCCAPSRAFPPGCTPGCVGIPAARASAARSAGATASASSTQRAGDSAPPAAQGDAVPAQRPGRIPRRDRPRTRQTEPALTRRSW
ncbi:hypothetical protein SBADM41S_02611 [Streptomyces badius]